MLPPPSMNEALQESIFPEAQESLLPDARLADIIPDHEPEIDHAS